MYEGSVCVWDVDMVAVHASGMSVFVLGFGWCDINEAIAVAGESTHSSAGCKALYFEHEV